MELGEKILRARQELGLSQRQLCGEEITRNMLSQIEHGTAHPSMKTLRYLAGRLEKPVSYFLDEEAEPVPAAQLLDVLNRLQKAEKALVEGRYPYVKELLAELVCTYPELERRMLLLLSRLPDAEIGAICAGLPSLDEELYLRARAALEAGSTERAIHLLEAMENRDTPQWHMMMGGIFLQRKDYRAAAGQFHAAEYSFPEETAPYLEQCYRELEDFKQAYFYACKQKT